MKLIVLGRLVVVAILGVSGCAQHVYGPELTEPGRVVAMSYMPRNHGTGAGYAFTGGKSGGGIVVTSVTIPEKYAIVFQCQHGSFVIENDEAQRLFTTLTQGVVVSIHYRVIYRRKHKDPKTDIPVDLDFLTAVPQ